MRASTGHDSAFNRLIEEFDVPVEMTDLLIQHSVIGSPTPVVRRQVIEGLKFEVGPQSHNRKIQFEDWLMWLRISVRAKFLCVREPLALYRIHDSQHTQSFAGKRRVAAIRVGMDLCVHGPGTRYAASGGRVWSGPCSVASLRPAGRKGVGRGRLSAGGPGQPPSNAAAGRA